MVPHGTPAPLAGAFSTNAEASGLAGGLPGGPACDIVVPDTDVAELLTAGHVPGDADELGGACEFVQNRTETLNPWGSNFGVRSRAEIQVLSFSHVTFTDGFRMQGYGRWTGRCL
jgi:hypothetical protein